MRSGPINSNRELKQRGFSLLEVMAAIMILSMFATSYLVTQGYHVSSSRQMHHELLLQKLCYNKMQAHFLKPPEFSDSLTLSPETGSFEEEGYPEYSYKIEYKRLTLPDLQKIMGSKSDEESSEEKESQANVLRDKIFEIFKKNVEQRIWQVRITVNEKDSDFSFSLSSLISNPKAPPMDISLFNFVGMGGKG